MRAPAAAVIGNVDPATSPFRAGRKVSPGLVVSLIASVRS